ncbi:MAG: type II secretion system protein GspC [Thermodesulfobacteriota bacterium]|nr:type II secretion system protein GspC [Thermodesulfobacteriota bacterium]
MVRQINTDMLRHLVLALNLVLIAVTVYAGVDFAYTIAADQLADYTPVAVMKEKDTRVSKTSRAKSLSDYLAIASRNIFQAAATEQKAPMQIDVENLKKTDLDLKLLGTIAGMKEDSYAVIEHTRKRKQNLYKVGDTIDNATVKLILRKKVVLTINGTDEVLEMEESLAGLEGNNAFGRGLDSGRQERSAAADRAGRVRNVTLNRSEVETAFNNVNELMRKVRIRPHFSNGRPDGLSLDSVSSGSIFSDMGLQSKDVIVGLNGKQINTVDDCMAVYRSLSSAAEVMLEVKRGGQKEFIKYNIR